MKILLVNKFYYLRGGAERHYFELKELLEQHGHEVIPFSMQHPDNFPTPWAKYFISPTNLEKPRLSPKSISQISKIFWNREASKKLQTLIDVTKPDLAHLHNIYHQISPSILPVLKKNNIPVVMTIHDFKLICPNYQLLSHHRLCERCQGGKYYHCFLQKCHKDSRTASLILTKEMYLHKLLGVYEKNIDWFISPSQFYKDKFVSFGQKAENISVIPNFINPEKYQPTGQYENYALYLGRLAREKGIFDLIQAWTKVNQDWHLKIVGTGPEQESLKQLTERLKLSTVELIGYRTGRPLAEIMERSLFTITPSIWYENCPMSVLESMAYGKAVIASRIGGLPELVTPSNGALFEPHDHQALASLITDFFVHREKTIALGDSGRKLIEQKYTPEQYHQQLIKIYERVKNN